MKLMRYLFPVCLISQVAFAAPTTVVSCEFGTGVEQHHKGVGTFDGPLPKGCGDNFSGWSAQKVTTSLGTEDGLNYTRFDSRGGSPQFMLSGFEATGPSFFRLKVKGRAIDDPIRFGIRQVGSPYRMFWEGSFKSPEWGTKEFVIRFTETTPQRLAVFVWPPSGVADLVSVTLETTSEEAFVAEIPRPPKSVKQFFRHTSFPLGLPSSWNVRRGCLDGTVTSEEGALVARWAPTPGLEKPVDFAFWTEPIQTNEPEKPVRVEVVYRAETPWSADIRDNGGKYVGGAHFPAAADWTTKAFDVRLPVTSRAMTVGFQGRSVFRLKSIRAWAAGEPPAPDREAEVALAPCGGEIGELTRVHFLGEVPQVKYAVVGDCAGAVLKATVTDLYGETRPLPSVRLVPDATGTLDYNVFPERPQGQFRVDAWVERDGKAVSPVEELVMTRLRRPVAWNRDAPDSPFASHFVAQESTIAIMKACGVNWARFHDASTDLSGWAHLEPRKGEWFWRDRDIARYRDRHVKIFAQLGTAPAYATHFGDLGYTNMGYFERYLRPTNDVDTATYVKGFVSRYKGVIDDYFVWNEPWGGWWKSAADIKYYDPAKAGFDYGVFSKKVIGWAREANPAISVCGYNTFSGETGRRWTQEVDESGLFADCDAVDFHYYTTSKRCRPGRDSVATDEPFAPLRAHHPDLGGKAVYMTEGQGSSGGTSTSGSPLSGLYDRSVPWPAESVADLASEADATCRYVVSLLAEGVRRVFLYSSHCYTALAVTPSFLQLLAADGYPHATTVAFAHMAARLEGKRFVSKTVDGEKGVYRFEGPDGVTEIWTGLSAAEALKLPNATDLYGNPLTPETFRPGTLVYVAR